ncbi:MAG: hypothetical protein IT555_05950 [Acetobacteraceae bacterium]|nr:hypothetical protein [Acetobacteraceae bacterium]
MSVHPPSLADHLASLRCAAEAEQQRAWAIAAIHTLIASLLARIFGRLEALAQLWQSGQLPLPQPRRTRSPPAADTPRPPAPRASRHPRARRRHPRANHARPGPHTCEPPARAPGRRTAPRIAATPNPPSRATTPAARSHPARAPPPDPRPISCEKPGTHGRFVAPLLLR